MYNNNFFFKTSNLMLSKKIFWGTNLSKGLIRDGRGSVYFLDDGINFSSYSTDYVYSVGGYFFIKKFQYQHKFVKELKVCSFINFVVYNSYVLNLNYTLSFTIKKSFLGVFLNPIKGGFIVFFSGIRAFLPKRQYSYYVRKILRKNILFKNIFCFLVWTSNFLKKKNFYVFKSLLNIGSFNLRRYYAPKLFVNRVVKRCCYSKKIDIVVTYEQKRVVKTFLNKFKQKNFVKVKKKYGKKKLYSSKKISGSSTRN